MKWISYILLVLSLTFVYTQADDKDKLKKVLIQLEIQVNKSKDSLDRISLSYKDALDSQDENRIKDVKLLLDEAKNSYENILSEYNRIVGILNDMNSQSFQSEQDNVQKVVALDKIKIEKSLTTG